MQADQEPHPAFICPITNDLFIDPVIAEDGHTYERAAITDWLKKNSTSPQTRIKMTVENLKPNLIVKSMMNQFYKFQQQAKQLKNVNAQFSNKFSAQINKLSKDKLQKEYQKILENLNIQAFVCPLTKKIFQEPVLASDGITYEKKAIEGWLLKNDSSPVTKEKLQNKAILPNHATKSMIDLFKQEQKQWKNLKDTEKNLIYVFAPKIKETLRLQVLNLQKRAAERLLTNWQDSVDLKLQKEQILKKQAELSAYSLKDDKYKFQIPQPIETFVGREKDLQMIDQHFSKENIVCLVGPGGMGKTQLATQYIKRSRFPSVIWLHGQNKLLIFQIQTYMKKAHNENLQNQKSQDVLLEKFYKILGPKALVIIDNVENAEQIKDFLPKNNQTKILLTSRYKKWKYPTVELSQFSQDDMLNYLQKILEEQNRKGKIQQMKTLYNLLGGLPLAISQAVGCIKQDKNLTIQKYIQLFKKSQSQSTLDKSEDKFNNVYTTLILALHNVRKQNDLIDSVLDVIGYMSPQQLDKNLVLSYLQSQQNKWFRKSKSQKNNNLFKILCNYFIITQNSSQDQNIFTINRLTQSVVRMIHKKNGSFNQKYTKFANWLLKKMYYDERSLKNIQRVTSFIPHGLAVANIQNTSFYQSKNQLLRQIGYHQFYQKKNYLQSKIYFQEALKISQSRVSNKEDQDMLVRILNDLGCVYSDLGNYHKQVKIHQKALKFSQQFLGKNSQRTAQVLTNLGRGYGLLKKYQKQKYVLQRALQIKEKYLKLGRDHVSISKTLIHLATAEGNMGNHKKKKQLLLRALAISQKYYGKNHPANDVILMNLGNANQQLGNNEESLSNLQKSLKRVQKNLGNQHPDYALAAMNYAVSLIKSKKFDLALQYLKRSYEIYEKNFGPNNPQTLNAYQNIQYLSHLMKNQQNLINQPTGKIIHQNLKGDKNMQNFQQENFNQSQQEQKLMGTQSNEKYIKPDKKGFINRFFQRKIDSIKDSFYKGHPLIYQGTNFFNRGNYHRAIEIYTQALKKAQIQRGKNHFSLGNILNLLGSAHNQIYQFNKSFKYLSRALKINSSHYGECSSDTATTLGNIGGAYIQIGQPHKAKQFNAKALMIMHKLYGPKHQVTQDTLYNLMLALKRIQQQEKGKKKSNRKQYRIDEEDQQQLLLISEKIFYHIQEEIILKQSWVEFIKQNCSKMFDCMRAVIRKF